MDVLSRSTQTGSLLCEINRINSQQDLSSFEQIWTNNQDQFLKQMAFLRSSWEMSQLFYEQELQKFQDIIREKFQNLEKYEILLPKLSQFIQYISKINDQYQQRKSENIRSSSFPDLLFKQFLLDTSRRKNKQASFIRNDYGQRVLLQDFIGQHEYYSSNRQCDIRWQYIFRRIQSYYQFDQIASDENLKQHQLMDDFLSDIENDKIPSIQCIGCCRFFFTNTNIYHHQYNNTELVVIGPIIKMKELETKLKNQICRLLNGNGGIILFDSVKKYRDIIPQGYLLTPQLRAQYEQRISSFMQTIIPRPQQANFTISFVPMVKSPLQQKKQSERKKVTDGSTFESSYFQREYIDGFYVTRIKIEPTTGQKLYFWVNDSKPIFPIEQNGALKFIQGKHISRMIKKRFKKYYIPENATNVKQLKLMRPKLSYFHPGKCEEPSLGVELIGMLKRPEQININFQRKFKDVSMVIARRSDLTYIKQRLANKGYKCEISPKFTEYKFKYSSSSALMYHDARFDILLQVISNKKQFQFAGKYTKLLCITIFIKLEQRNVNKIPQEKLQEVQRFFNKQYPNEQIKLWKYTHNSQVEHYFQVDRKSKLKTVYLFYILSDLGEKVSLKNPKNFDKLTPEMINSRFRIQYPLNTRLQNKYLAELYYESNNSSANSFNSQSR